MQTSEEDIPGREEATNKAAEPRVCNNASEQGEYRLKSMYEAFTTYLNVRALSGSPRDSNGPSSS